MPTKWTIDLDVPSATSSVARISFRRTAEGGFSDPIVSPLRDAIDETQALALGKEASDAIKAEAKRQGRWPLTAK